MNFIAKVLMVVVILTCLAIAMITAGCTDTTYKSEKPIDSVATPSGPVLLPSQEECYNNNCLVVVPMCEKHIVCVVAHVGWSRAYTGGTLGGVDCKSYQEAPVFYTQYCSINSEDMAGRAND